MKSNLTHLLYLGIIIALCASSCRPLYRSSIPYQPMLTEAKEVDIKVGLETGTAYTNVSYALTDHFFLMAGANAWSNRHSTAQFGEVGLGLFNVKDGWGKSLMATVGYGASTVETEDFFQWGFNDFITSEIINSQFARVAFQPGIYMTKQSVEFSFATRASMLYWLASNDPGATASSYDLFLEPVVGMRAGSAVTKFFLETSMQLPVYRSFSHSVYPFHFGFGVNFMISANRFKAMTK